jgi:hypothetical protein
MLAAEKVKCKAHNGEIEFMGNVYHSDATAQLAGNEVIIRFDPEKLQQPVAVYTLDNRFKGEAECRLPQGYLSKDAGREDNRLRNQNKRMYRRIARNEQRQSELLPPLMPGMREPEPPRSNVVRMLRLKLERSSTAGEPELLGCGFFVWRKDY